MNKGHVKLPDVTVLKQHIAAGMDRGQIAERYGCSRESVRCVLRKAGLIAPRAKPAQQVASHVPRPHRTFRRTKVDILNDRIVFTREVTAGQNGGTMITRTSLPRLSMYVAALQDAKRC
jgi:hypothetical protein